jgi:hypothetical protein
MTLACDGYEWSASQPSRLTLGERAPGSHCIEYCMGPRASMNAVEKRNTSCTCRESNSDSLAIQAIAITILKSIKHWLKKNVS